MKTKMHFSLLLVTFVLLLSSCSNMISIEKRKYRSGFYIEHAAKPSLTNSNSAPAVVATASADAPATLNQFKEDSVVTTHVCTNQNFTQNKIDAEVKNKKKNTPAVSQKKTVKTALPAPVHFKKQSPAIKNMPGEEDEEDENDGTGVLIFFVILASAAIAFFGLGIAALFLLYIGSETLALVTVIGGLLAIAGADVLIIHTILRNRRGNPHRETE